MSYRLATRLPIQQLGATPWEKPCGLFCKPKPPEPSLPPPTPEPSPAPAPSPGLLPLPGPTPAPEPAPPPGILPAPPPPQPPSLNPGAKPRVFLWPGPPKWIPGGVVTGSTTPAPPKAAPRLPIINLGGSRPNGISRPGFAPRLPIVQQPLATETGGIIATPTVTQSAQPGGEYATDAPAYTYAANGADAGASATPAGVDWSKLLVPGAIVLAALFSKH